MQRDAGISKDNATSNDDVMMLGVVWIRLPVLILTDFAVVRSRSRFVHDGNSLVFTSRSQRLKFLYCFQVEKVKKIILICKVIFCDMIFVPSNGKTSFFLAILIPR